MLKKSKLLLTLSLGATLILSACGSGSETTNGSSNSSPQPAAAVTKVKLGLVCGSLNPYLAVAASIDGTFTRNGLDVEQVCFSSGADAVQALVGGSIDINLGSYEHVLRQRNQKLDVKAYGALYNGVGYALLVKKNSPITKVTDLKGKTIGVTKVGSLSDTGLKLIVAGDGLNAEKDITTIGAGSGATMLAALDGDRIAGGMVNQPSVEQMVATGNYRVLVDPNHAYVGIVAMAKTDWVAKNQVAMQNFLTSLKEVHASTTKDPKKAAQNISKDYDQIPLDILEKALISELKKMPADLELSKAGADGVVQSQVELGTISNSVPFEETIDLSLLKK